VFDSNVGEQPLSVPMPANYFIEAWDEALRLMRDGTKAKIIAPYELAYGPEGREQIPPYTPLVFDLHINSVGSGE
jgi:FKBP-type peptidyl-prolyl cis-trans isomerase FkpA